MTIVTKLFVDVDGCWCLAQADEDSIGVITRTFSDWIVGGCYISLTRQKKMYGIDILFNWNECSYIIDGCVDCCDIDKKMLSDIIGRTVVGGASYDIHNPEHVLSELIRMVDLLKKARSL